MPQTGADLIVDALADAGVSHIFSLSGNQILPVYNTLIGRDIRLIHTRHEAAAVHMADAWGRLTEQPGIALVPAGPGHGNTIGALYVAQMAESPVVLLSGHCPAVQVGHGAFQETDQAATAAPVTKASWQVAHPDQIASDITAALSIATTGRPGPVHLSLPFDMLEADIAGMRQEPGHHVPAVAPAMPDTVMNLLLGHLQEAKRPIILAGPAMSRPTRFQALTELAGQIHMPVLIMESPRGLNDPFLRYAPACLAEADLVLLVGKKLDFSLKFGQPPFFNVSCDFIKIDAEPETVYEGQRAVIHIHADPVASVQHLIKATRSRSWPMSTWPDEVTTACRKSPESWVKIRHASRQPIHPLLVCDALQPHLNAGGILISDGGEFGQWAQAALETPIRLINGPAGAIGGAIPAALSAKLVHPDHPVFVTTGDGAFGYHTMEMDTALRYDIPIIVIVGNDARWNAEYQLQRALYGADRIYESELRPIRYDHVVAALGGYGECVEHPEDLSPALQRAVESGRPACINVSIEGAAAPVFN